MTLLEIERLAKAAAVHVEARITEMLTGNEEGEIVVTVGQNEVYAFKRRKEFVFRQKLDRGHYSAIRGVKT